MSENLKKLQKFINELNTTRTKYSDYTQTAVPAWFRKFEQDKRRPPRDFKDSSFMFIRSYEGDVGDRPFPSGL